MAGRLVLLTGSPRIAPGLLTRSAWLALGAAASVCARDADEPLAAAVTESGMPVRPVGGLRPPELARTLVGEAAEQQVVWVGSADGDPGLTDAIAAEVTRLQDPPEVELVVGSWDVPGSRLLDLVAVMDRLRSPGGCPWDAEQTHESLVKYLIEEAHEAAEAIHSGDRGHMVEELGDVLLQVAFQSRVGEEHPEHPFDIDDVAGAIVEKLLRRHPHVFADGTATTPDEVEGEWERIKAQERAAKGTARRWRGGPRDADARHTRVPSHPDGGREGAHALGAGRRGPVGRHRRRGRPRRPAPRPRGAGARAGTVGRGPAAGSGARFRRGPARVTVRAHPGGASALPCCCR